ncbi:cytochrome c oxidase, cbb3-type, subunit II [Methylocella silvestris BL2]|uniref:Cytochrome c oxidase, cbb3-type, subunit II n=1 Tax=Methylocella silvestris (strain DSM 15510 / CIP 108128 / LMG 27833 / NCIMB 13906 / BL2) TaxID=395965 RepID=B8EJ53_METSB|nr:cytochrome-c oxidase, cbb3-type subunit II [Methylocella silvestris]ACK52545.1 cytochrome c oxidase, cbb3-type, subunit II [Methylocella silvestris BL2]
MSATNQAPTPKRSLWDYHAIFEKNSIILVIGILIAISIGGLVEIVPLFFLKATIEKVDGVRPKTPLELAGFDIYVREGCYLCHSQQIRALRDEVERYGHYSLAAESMYDHPFQWGSKRNGPDLARIGGKYSDDWHRDHLRHPQAVVPASIMPRYGFLEETPLDGAHIADNMKTLALVGVPYTQDMIDKAQEDLSAQGSPDSPGVADLQARYPKASAHEFGADKRPLTEADAVIAYLQQLGTQIDFKIYDNKANIR